MNAKQKEEIREEFLNKTELKGKIGENLLDNLIDKYLTSQREEIVEKIQKNIKIQCSENCICPTCRIIRIITQSK